jgi:hypothetical protein
MAKHPELDILENLLSRHDWYYNYADDGRSYRKGQMERDEINRQIRVCESLDLEHEANQLYKQYSK